MGKKRKGSFADTSKSAAAGTPRKGPANQGPYPLFREDRETSRFFLSWWKPLLVVFAVAALARIAQLLFIWANDPSFAICLKGVDTYQYDEWALKILKGDWMSKDQPVFYYGPLYPYFLAAIYGAFGHIYAAAHSAQFFVGALTSALVYLGSAQWFSRRVAMIAGLAMALCSGVLFYEGFLLPESLSFFLIASFLALFGVAQNRPLRLWLWPLVGLALGLAIAQRANMLLCLIALIPWVIIYFWKTRRYASIPAGVIFCALMLVGVAVPLSATCLHNGLIGKEWVLVTSNGPNLLYIGNAHDAGGTFEYPESFSRLQEEEKTRKVSMQAELLRDISQNPEAWVRLMAKKFYLFWAAYDPADNFSYDLFRKFSPLTRFNPIGYALIVPLAFVGMGIGLRNWRRLSGLYIFIAAFCASIVIVFIVGRYRLHVVTALCGFAALGFWRIAGLLKTRDYRMAALLLGVALVVGVLLSLYAVNPLRIRPNDFGMLASYYKKANQPRKSDALLRQAESYYLDMKPGDERKEEARKIALGVVRNERAQDLFAEGNWTEAEAVLLRTIDDGFRTLQGYDLLIKSLLAQGKKQEAIILLEQLIKSMPEEQEWRTLMEKAKS